MTVGPMKAIPANKLRAADLTGRIKAASPRERKLPAQPLDAVEEMLALLVVH